MNTPDPSPASGRGEPYETRTIMSDHPNNYPKLHNAAWPGLVGKGDGGEPPIDLDTMLDLTAAAEVDGVEVRRLRHLPLPSALQHRRRRRRDRNAWPTRPGREASRSARWSCRSIRAPAAARPWAARPIRRSFWARCTRRCHVARRLRELGVRPHGVVRIDSVCSVEAWSEDPKGNQKRIADTFREACKIAEDHGERLAAEGEICWGGMHSWRAWSSCWRWSIAARRSASRPTCRTRCCS